MNTNKGPPSLDSGDGNCYFELSFAPSIALVSIVRRFVASFLNEALGLPGDTSRIAVAVHELLENAVKFSVDGECAIRVEVSPAGEMRRVWVRTRNRGETDEIETLSRLFAQLEQAENPMEFYLSRFETSTQSERSQLGIGRIAAESGMALEFSVEGDYILICAHTRIEGGHDQ